MTKDEAIAAARELVTPHIGVFRFKDSESWRVFGGVDPSSAEELSRKFKWPVEEFEVLPTPRPRTAKPGVALATVSIVTVKTYKKIVVDHDIEQVTIDHVIKQFEDMPKELLVVESEEDEYDVVIEPLYDEDAEDPRIAEAIAKIDKLLSGETDADFSGEAIVDGCRPMDESDDIRNFMDDPAPSTYNTVDAHMGMPPIYVEEIDREIAKSSVFVELYGEQQGIKTGELSVVTAGDDVGVSKIAEQHLADLAEKNKDNPWFPPAGLERGVITDGTTVDYKTADDDDKKTERSPEKLVDPLGEF